MSKSGEIWTIGHSNRTAEEFLELLRGASIAVLADVRRFPGSKKHPQFGREALEASLHAAGIGYQHFPALGGRRSRSRTGSPNTAWRVEAFNAYADHMQTSEFQTALDGVMDVAEDKRTCIMCAEALPWQCHRRLISDALIVRGWTVQNIMSRGSTRPHTLTEFAHVDGAEVTYPGGTLFEK
jgi:uncharacterized protein (DUF488 family)